ncbi:uncharacterized protein LOC129608408 [Condylostylus longicornis]|uniref:uncharacterized protein LOC129608408 n=1 Tax=Condylostylus longicornis TaxID=2530218 RepID=UPI00244E2EA2|nr:uncharacterized protein LOC129608408 [Condylostylus longicornis]
MSGTEKCCTQADNIIREKKDVDIYSRSYNPGTLTKQKFELLGTHEAVKESHRSYFVNQKHHKDLATAHVTKINREASCSIPKPRIERIQGDASKKYVPHCTILHRCSDDTGCCSSDLKTCVAKKTQEVDLFFYVKSINSKQGTIERLTFQNHTECHCVRKTREKSSLQNLLLEPALLRRATVLDCNCPKLFEKVLQDDGYCRCDCSSGNSDCDWLKRGMEHFSMVDRKCILEGRCKPPTCEFGSYDKKHGRCPRKDDKLFSRSFD